MSNQLHCTPLHCVLLLSVVDLLLVPWDFFYISPPVTPLHFPSLDVVDLLLVAHFFLHIDSCYSSILSLFRGVQERYYHTHATEPCLTPTPWCTCPVPVPTLLHRSLVHAPFPPHRVNFKSFSRVFSDHKKCHSKKISCDKYLLKNILNNWTGARWCLQPTTISDEQKFENRRLTNTMTFTQVTKHLALKIYVNSLGENQLWSSVPD